MGTIYTEFSTTVAALVADLRAAILTSSDWAQPNAAGLPNLLKATTTRGAQIAIDLNVANTNPLQRQIVRVFRSHDGTTPVGPSDKSIWYRRSNSGVQADTPLHVKLSAGKEHIWYSIEGPRAGQPNADNGGNGSLKNDFWICDVVPYFPTLDTSPVVCVSSNRTGISYDQNVYDGAIYTYSATQDYRTGKLGCIHPASANYGSLNRKGWDGDLYLSPYTVHEDQYGMRGRLAEIFHAGFNFYDSAEAPIVPNGSRVVYGGKAYKIVAPYRSSGDGYYNEAGSLGYIGNISNAQMADRSVLVAVPTV
jgi:hypothetical protein